MGRRLDAVDFLRAEPYASEPGLRPRSLWRAAKRRDYCSATVMTRSIAFAFTLAALVAGCSSGPRPAPDVADSVRAALKSRGLNDVSVSQDRDKGVVTLSGTVRSDDDKMAAASAAQSAAASQVVANEVVVTPPGLEHRAEAIHDALDDGIESNMKALLIRLGSPPDVTCQVKAGVVTLTGSVQSQARRSEVEKAAAGVANVKQVVNELQVKAQRATSTPGKDR